MAGDETELLAILLNGMEEGDVREAVRAMNEAPPEKPAGRRRRRSSRPAARAPRRTGSTVQTQGEAAGQPA
ncbi:MAG: hypothetical protein ACJ735_02875 [Actinomycetes bacterium]